jgi:hypothetical protein
VERRSRAALKKAPVRVVLCLELQALQLVEQVGAHLDLLRRPYRQAPQQRVALRSSVWSSFLCPACLVRRFCSAIACMHPP